MEPNGTSATDRILHAGRCVIVSPHLDDGILSCGGLVAGISRAVPVEIWTVFARAPLWGPYSPLAKWFHGISGGLTGARLAWMRRREDASACGVVGATARHLNLYDAIYRKGSDGKALYDKTQLSGWHADEQSLIREITNTLELNLRPTDIVLVPLGVGRHVDHLIVRSAVERVTSANLLFYQDVPYIKHFKDELLAQSAGMKCMPYPVSSPDIDSWIKAVMRYKTQIKMLEDSVGSLATFIQRFSEQGHICLYAK